MKTTRPVIDSLLFHCLVVENSLNILNSRCWENGDDTPSDNVDPDVMQTVKESLERIHATVSEIETANQYFDHTYEPTIDSNKRVDDLVSTGGAA